MNKSATLFFYKKRQILGRLKVVQPIVGFNLDSCFNEEIEFDEEENIIVVGTKSEDITQNNDGEDGWVCTKFVYVPRKMYFLYIVNIFLKN